MNEEEIEELKDFTIDINDIDELALGLEVCSKKSNMVIQEFADLIIELQQENKKLKKQIEEINKFKFSYKKDQTKIPPIIRKQKDVETIKKLENQQKEFIEWLTNEANINPYDISDYTYEDIINTILSKYYEIIG